MKASLKVQALSGVVFAAFLFVHLSNQMLATLGAERYDDVQRTLRRGYQAPLLEMLLVLAPLLVHVSVSLARWWSRRHDARAPTLRCLSLHRWSGRVLLLVFLGHVGATRGASFFFGVFPGFAGLAFTFRWVPAYFWPYYLLLALCGWYHLVHGLSVALPSLGVRGLLRPLVFRTIVGLGAVALVLGVLSLGGVFFDVGDPMSSEYARLVLRLTAR